MNNSRLPLYSLSTLLLILITCACGPSQAQLDETATHSAISMQATQTAEAPTSTPVLTNTQTTVPTNTPTPSATSTPTPTFTPTPTPEPDPSAMLDWMLLKLPSSYVAYNPANAGIEKGNPVIGDGTTDLVMESGFAFVNDDGSAEIFGYTLPLGSQALEDMFGWPLYDLTDYMTTTYEGAPDLEVIPNPDLEEIGDVSSGATATFTYQGTPLQFDGVAFQIGDVGALVFLLRTGEVDPEISVESVNNRLVFN